MSVKAIVLAFLALPHYRLDRHESLEERTALVTPVAEAIFEVTKVPVEQAALVSVSNHESKLARYVLEGRCTDGPVGERCDLDKNGVPRAAGPFQVWAVTRLDSEWARSCRAAHVNPGSREALFAGARCALGKLRHSYARCGRTWEGAFSGYKATPCRWSGAEKRVVTMRKVLAMLYANEKGTEPK